MRRAVARDRFVVRLLSAFSLAALLLGAVGVYGVIFQTVRSRTRETGLRVAMGADRGQIARGVLLDGLRVAMMGGAIGLVGGLALSLQLSKSILHVSALDPVSYLIVLPTLCVIVLLASWIPARHAARIDPVRALQQGS